MKAPETADPSPNTPTTDPPRTSSSIQLTTRDDLSLAYRVLRAFLLRPLRPHLVRPGKPFPAGSPRLSAPKKRNCEVEESQCENVWQYTLRPQPRVRNVGRDGKHSRGAQQQKRKKHRVYYFWGGGFQSGPSGEHWRFLAQLAQDLAGESRASTTPPADDTGNALSPELGREFEFTLASYPLAPASPAVESLEILRKWLRRVLDDAGRQGDRVTLMGDSSGGNLALSLGFWAVENYPQPQERSSEPPNQDGGHVEDETRGKSHPSFPLTSLLCISPAVDLRNTNPDIPKHHALDPILTEELTSRVAQAWTAKIESSKSTAPSPHPSAPISTSDPAVSPLLNSDAAFRALRDRGVAIHGVVGTHDVLAPDALELMRKCERLEVPGRWLVWKGQMHCFPLAGGGENIGIREGREGRAFIGDILRHDAQEP